MLAHFKTILSVSQAHFKTTILSVSQSQFFSDSHDNKSLWYLHVSNGFWFVSSKCWNIPSLLKYPLGSEWINVIGPCRTPWGAFGFQA